MRKNYIIALVILFSVQVFATKLETVTVLDKDYIHLVFIDGDATFVDDANGNCPHDHCEDLSNNDVVWYGAALSTINSQNNSTYSITSSDDGNYSSAKQPTDVHRKSKLHGMVQRPWINNDYTYDFPFEHHVFLKLPNSLVQGDSYTIAINGNTNTDQTSVTFTYDIYNTRSEAVKVNVVGYTKSNTVKAADVYYWMGDGDARDYSSFIGNKIYLYNVGTQNAVEVGALSFGKNEATEQTHGHKMLMSDTWNADFTGNYAEGTYKLAIEGIGCSDEFEISDEVYKEPFGVSVLGFFYMRIGQDNLEMTPVPRRPLYIPNSSPANCKVYLTEMSPYHPQWDSFTSGDQWDQEQDWVQYKLPGNPTNPNAYGGHSDALDWDRYLGHVSSIYDMLLPYIITDGAQSDDDLRIAESGNGIPDLIDEAKNEVDFWLRLRDQNGGYSHGLTNPDGDDALYQAAATAVAAWANAANAAMLAQAYDIAGQNTLRDEYRDSAIVAYNYASALPDQQLNKTQGVGMITMSGQDFKTMAAAYLYNITGNTDYEVEVQNSIGITNGTSEVTLSDVYAVAGYLFTPQVVHYQSLYDNMKAAVVYHAKDKEANYSLTRPSRRSTDNNVAWMQTEIALHRTIVAHAITDNASDKQLLENALVLEADYSLGRNPLNRVLMTTATTALENERSIENAFTSGWDDGSPGVHPGHTPYLNVFSWGGDRYMGNPEKMAKMCYPNALPGASNTSGMAWPMGEMYFDTRYVYAHSEFTPQQTMRGKTALYAYLYGLGPNCDKPDLGADISICGASEITLNSNLASTGRSFSWEGPLGVINGATSSTLSVTTAGEYRVISNEGGCVKSDRIKVKGELDPIFLGDDINLCATSSVTLNAQLAGNGYSYEWEKNGVAIVDKEEQTLVVNKPAVYRVTVYVAGCPSQSDEIEVSTSLATVKEDTTCGPGKVNLEILDAGSYSWHSGEYTDDLLSTAMVYEPTITQTTTYYVEAAGEVTDFVGLPEPGNATWIDWADAHKDKTEFTVVSSEVTLVSVKVMVQQAGNVTVNLYAQGNNTPIETVTRSNVPTGLEEIQLDFIVPAGNYALNTEGTSARLTLDNENGTYVAYPYTINNVLSITGVDPAWANNRYMFLYDWEVAYSGTPCVRTPVEAIVLDAQDPTCNITGNDDLSNALEGVYPNPTSDRVLFSSNQSFEVYSITGELLLEGKSESVSLSDFPSGLYLIRTEGGVHQVIKE